MIDLIYKIKNSTPTQTDPDFFINALSSFLANPDYIFISSRASSFESVLQCSILFVEQLATIKFDDTPELSNVPALQPLHVIKCEDPDNPTACLYGLLYSNGLVIYTEGVENLSSMLLVCPAEYAENGFFGEGSFFNVVLEKDSNEQESL